MSVPRQQPHAIAKFKHQVRTAVPKQIVTPAHMTPLDVWSAFAWDNWGPTGKRRTSEMKRFKARAARKSRK